MRTLIIVVLLVAGCLFTGERGVSMSVQDRARVRAPEIQGGSGWLNTDKPLSIAALKGKVVLLDFWTYGCINCIHIIPDLKKLEEKYANQLVVIGVHSAKFKNEKETENIRRIILLSREITMRSMRRSRKWSRSFANEASLTKSR